MKGRERPPIGVLEWPERWTGRVIIAIAALFAVAYGSSLVLRPKPDGRIVMGDALHHYVQVRSAIFDRDLHFRNEYVRMYRLDGQHPETQWVFEPTATGHVRNLMPVGPGLLWAAPMLALTAVVWTLNQIGVTAYPIDGYGRVFQAVAGLTGIAAAAAGVWLSTLASAELFGRRAAAWAALVAWLATSAVYYSLISPTYSHAASLLAAGAFWYAFVRTRYDISVRRYVVLGAAAGAAALMRWQDAVILAVVALDLFWRIRGGLPVGRAIAFGAASLVVAATAFLPQMIVWQTLYGQPLAMPQGEGFMRWGEPALMDILFSDWHGLLTWTPIVGLALAGLAAVWRRDRRVGAAALLFFALSWYVNAAVADWWAGEAFGARRFVSCVPVFTLGLAALIAWWAPSTRTLAVAGTVAIAHTFLLLVQYQAFMHGLREVVPYPRGAYELWLARFVVPYDLAAYWWRTGA
jgi:hypothetical protein